MIGESLHCYIVTLLHCYIVTSLHRYIVNRYINYFEATRKKARR